MSDIKPVPTDVDLSKLTKDPYMVIALRDLFQQANQTLPDEISLLQYAPLPQEHTP